LRGWNIENQTGRKEETAMKLKIEKMRREDWNSVLSIYKEGIDTGNATFEVDIPEWDNWNANHLQEPRLVARSGSQVVGWAALCPVSDRCAYEGVAEVSIYIAGHARGLGIGKSLLKKLISRSESAGIWTLQAGVFSENEASLELHRSCGFREVGLRERLGKLNGVWRDVILLERRSKLVGVS
jgi:L-amino acid N-acyltransferase YncA